MEESSSAVDGVAGMLELRSGEKWRDGMHRSDWSWRRSREIIIIFKLEQKFLS